MKIWVIRCVFLENPRNAEENRVFAAAFLALIATGLVALSAASNAEAAMVSMIRPTDSGIGNSRVLRYPATVPTYTAARGERNTVLLSTFKIGRVLWFQFDEINRIGASRAVPLRVADGCTYTRPATAPRFPRANVRRSAYCRVGNEASTTAIVIAGNLDDQVVARDSIEEREPSDDRLTEADRVKAHLIIEGGSGSDVLGGGGMNDSICAGELTRTADPFNSEQGQRSCTGSETFNPAEPIPADLIHGGGGNDTLYGNDDEDSISGDEGVDVIFGGGGDDVLIGGPGEDFLYGEDGNDAMDVSPGGVPGPESNIKGNDHIWGGPGDEDAVGYTWSRSAAIASPGSGYSPTTGHDEFDGAELLYGSKYNDSLSGWPAIPDIIYGLEGDDIIDVSGDPRLSYADLANCGEGNDEMIGDGRPLHTEIMRDKHSDCETTTLQNDGI